MESMASFTKGTWVGSAMKTPNFKEAKIDEDERIWRANIEHLCISEFLHLKGMASYQGFYSQGASEHSEERFGVLLRYDFP